MGNKNIKFGGPVKISVVHVLHNDPMAEGSKLIVPGIYYGGRVNTQDQEVKTLSVNGHAEWRSLQLDGEINAGTWLVLPPARSEDIFTQLASN
jgi:putative AlgH/UPF0301 family transcriptional regulator